MLKRRWTSFLVISAGIRGSTFCSVATARLNSVISTVFVGRVFFSGETSDAAGMRSGWRRPNLTPRIHSSLDPSCRLMSICPEGTLTEAVDRSSPEWAGFFCLWRGGAVWVEENAVSGLVEESCGVLWRGGGCL